MIRALLVAAVFCLGAQAFAEDKGTAPAAPAEQPAAAAAPADAAATTAPAKKDMKKKKKKKGAKGMEDKKEG